MKRATRLVALSVAAMMALSACGNDSDSTTGDGSSAAPKTPPVWSLTGLPGPDDAQIKPIMVVKVENDPVVRPQTGLEHADLIFEELVEGGMTRFATVFQSDVPDEIGPVRSVRHVDVSIAEPMADVFVFSGGAARTMRFVRRKLPTTISVANEGAPGMYRKDGLSAPHDLFLKPAELLNSVAQNDTPSGGFFVRPDMPATAPAPSGSASATTKAPLAVTNVGIQFSGFGQPNWKWDATKNQWLRSEGVKPFLNKDGSQFGTDNLIIIEVREIDAGYKGSTGGYVPRTVLTGSGRAWVLSKGTATELAWNKPRVDAQMTMTDLDGNPYVMPTGRSWVELLPVETTGKYSFDGAFIAMKKAPLPAAEPEPSDSETP